MNFKVIHSLDFIIFIYLIKLFIKEILSHLKEFLIHEKKKKEL